MVPRWLWLFLAMRVISRCRGHYSACSKLTIYCVRVHDVRGAAADLHHHDLIEERAREYRYALYVRLFELSVLSFKRSTVEFCQLWGIGWVEQRPVDVLLDTSHAILIT